jgi:hypothetical protein
MTTATPFVTDRTRSGYDTLFVDDIGDDKLIEMAHQALERPSDSAWWDKQMYVTHTTMFATVDPDLSDEDLRGLSNLKAVGRDLTEAWPKAVEESSFGHWTYSRFLCLKVRVIRRSGEIHPAFAAACAIALNIVQRNPLYDDEDYNTREMAAWDKVDTQLEAGLRAELAAVTDDEPLAPVDIDFYVDDVISWLHDHDGCGYRSEFYYPDEVVETAKLYALNRIGMSRPVTGQLALFD